MIIASILLLCATVFSVFYTNTYMILGVDVINYEDTLKIQENREQFVFDKNLIVFNNEKLPYDQNSNTLFIPQKISSDYEGTISCVDSRYNIKIIKPEYSKSEIMSSDIAIDIILYDENSYSSTSIKLSGIPIISISNSLLINYDYSEGKHDYSATMRLYDQEGKRDTFECNEYYIEYHERGNATRINPKKSYKINLKDKAGNKLNDSLLSMRNDDDWILNSLSFDGSYVRETLSRDIWNNIDSSIQLNSQYVEVFKDDEYIGLYALQEPLDFKTFEANDDDILVKVNDWLLPQYISNDLSKNYVNLYLDDRKNECAIDELEFDNCSSSNYQERINIYNELRKLAQSGDSSYFQFDWDNSIKLHLYLNMTMGVDNTYKNARLLLSPLDYGYEVKRGVWDFDYNFMISTNVYGIFIDSFIPNGYIDSEQFFIDSKQYFNQYVNVFYNFDYLCNVILSYESLLRDSGAIVRDSVKWDGLLTKWDSTNHNQALNDLLDIIENRINFLNEYYEFSEE